MMRYLLVNVQKINSANPGQTPQQGRVDLAILCAKSNATKFGKSSMLDNFICAKKRTSGIALVQNDNIIYCCLPLFCAAGPISLLKAM